MRLFVIEILDFFSIQTDEIIIHFISEERTKLLHGLFFSNNETTDCMSFPIDGTEKRKENSTHTLGECFINPLEAALFDKDHPYTELSRLLTHCILHLIGHTDQTDSEKKSMRALEDRALKHAKEKKVLLTNPHPL
ncbi:MAG: Endoribonuclease YbeY [Chlamydiia bacterium]|nr:Endoribonuclease YbeY [Chlamydiia bacterium]MCH9618124.1 Endoribonuclease YbeY [Chlamydiia bacterium]MCH9624004.1 Endoribonuclease YbeY [Chlamydiia bacterium]